MDMNCLPIKDQRKWDIQSIIKMWLVAKRNNITLRSEYASQNLVFLNKQNEFRSVGTPTDREMLLVAKRNNITLRSEYASQNLVPSWPPVHNESEKRSEGDKNDMSSLLTRYKTDAAVPRQQMRGCRRVRRNCDEERERR
jgi:hypothetical protein